MLPDHATDFLARYPDALPAAGTACALVLVLAAVLFTGRRRRAEPVMGIYQCHSCRAHYAVGLVRLPHERRARLVCTRPDCRVAYAVVPDGGESADVLRRAHDAYMRLMVRGNPPRNAGKRRAAVADAVPAVPAAPAEDWAGFDAQRPPPGLVPLPPPPRTRTVEIDAPGRNGP